MKFLTDRKIKKLHKRISVLFTTRQSAQVSDVQLKREVQYYHQLAALYDKHQYDKNFPHARERALENHRAAAEMGDNVSLHEVGKRLMEQGKFWLSFKEDYYQHESHKLYADALFKEAFKYLKTAHDQGYFLATRLLGVCYVNGWGVEMDVDGGAKHLVDSIEQEGAWDKASVIFSELGLNNPAFFTKFMSMKGNRDQA